MKQARGSMYCGMEVVAWRWDRNIYLAVGTIDVPRFQRKIHRAVLKDTGLAPNLFH